MYLAIVTLHVFAAMVWVGGTIFLSIVGAPVLRKVEPEALRSRLFEAIGVRFRYVGWAAVALLLGSGTVMLQLRGWLSTAVLGRGAFWSSPAGSAFAWKLVGVAVMIGLSAIHDLSFAPSRVSRLEARPDWPRRRRRLVWLGRAGALAALLVVVAAVRLARVR